MKKRKEKHLQPTKTQPKPSTQKRLIPPHSAPQSRTPDEKAEIFRERERETVCSRQSKDERVHGG